MNDISFFRDIGISILAAAALSIPAHILRVPLLLAYIIAGVVLGPHLGLGVIHGTEHISLLSEIGLVLLMFILGLEIDVNKLLQASKAVLINGVTQFLGCAALGYFFFSALGFKNTGNSFELVYLSVACSLSSTLIVVKILSDRMELDTFLSRITLGILVFQDLWAIAFLAIQPNLRSLSVSALTVSFMGVILLIVFCWLVARFILPKTFALVAKQSELVLLVAMAWCFTMCGLANHLKLSMEMGALMAGLMMASLPYHVDIAAKISSLRDFFITLFFVSLGLQIPKPSAQVLLWALYISVFVLLSRVLTMYPILFKMKYGNRASLLPALNLSQLSEFSLVLGALGVTYGHIRPELLSAFIFTLVITTLASSLLISKGHNIYVRLNPILEMFGLKDRVSAQGASYDQNSGADKADIVLLGFFREGSSLLKVIMSRHSEAALKKLLVVDFNPESHHKLMQLGVKCKYGDISNENTLKNLRLEGAKIMICTIADHNLKGTTNLKLLTFLKKLYPETRIIVTAETLNDARKMYELGADYVFIPRLISAHYLSDVLERLTLGEEAKVKTDAQSFINNWHEVLD